MTQHTEYGTIVNLHQFQNGNVSLTLRVKEYYSSEKGNVFGLPKFLSVNSKLSENLMKHFKKGDAIAVEFRISAVPYEKDGQTVYPDATLILNRVDFLPGGNKRETDSNESNESSSVAPQENRYSRVDEDPFTSSKGPIEVSEDDLPF